MKTNRLISLTKIGILILITVIGAVSCKPETGGNKHSIIRFEKLVFSIPSTKLADSIHFNHNNLVLFFRIFNEAIIKIGPDSLPGYAEQIERFTKDPMIRQVYTEVDKLSDEFDKSCLSIDAALKRWAELSGKNPPDNLITYISGFNQSFITLPDCLGIGIDNYLGSENPFYKSLAVPVYIRNYKNLENLTADAVRAWIYSELPEPSFDGGFLDRMIYEGKVYYIASKLLPEISDENLFHYTEDQIRWCREQEKAMWKYLAEQKILFSTDRLTIRKFLDEAPFTRDFGNESPGKAGVWIGYRVVSSYMKATGLEIKDLIGISGAKEILSGSKYHP